MLDSFSEKWVQTQLTHRVSLSAASAFWSLSFKYVLDILQLKENEGVKKNVPQFVHKKRILYKNICPDVKMSFAFLNKADGTIHHVHEDHTPLTQFQRDPQYQKLYEEAHIEVIIKKKFRAKCIFRANMQYLSNSN